MSIPMPAPVSRDTTEIQEDDVFVCQYCGAEARLTRMGDTQKMQMMGTFTCCCGTRMDKESRGT